MRYEGQICRTPRERASFMLPISVGCPYNRCKFCDLFKHLSYRTLPFEQVKAEVGRIAATGRSPRGVMLGDGNAFGVRTEDLLTVLELIHRQLPGCASVSADATISSIATKGDEELAKIATGGLRTLYIGIESGLDDVLAFMHKEHDNTTARRQIARLHAAGIEYGAHIMTGIAGHGRGIENARATAAFLNGTKPLYICNFSLFLHRDVELGREVERNSFVPASEQENLHEDRELVSLLEGPVDFDGFHDYVELRVHGSLPEDRERMLRQLDAAIKEFEVEEPLFSMVGSIARQREPKDEEDPEETRVAS